MAKDCLVICLIGANTIEVYKDLMQPYVIKKTVTSNYQCKEPRLNYGQKKLYTDRTFSSYSNHGDIDAITRKHKATTKGGSLYVTPFFTVTLLLRQIVNMLFMSVYQAPYLEIQSSPNGLCAFSGSIRFLW